MSEMMNFKSYKWPFHIMTHPFEGFEDLRWKKAGSMKVAWAIVIIFFLTSVATKQLTGFMFNNYYVKVFNVVPTITQTILLFLAWVAGNWAVGTFLNGEGSLKKIFIFSAYALVPKIIGDIICIIMSNLIIKTEAVFMSLVNIVFTGWTIILIFMAIKVVHQYKFWENIAAIVLTIVAIVIMLFLAVLLLTLFQQVYVFFLTIWTEIGYRFNV